ncbi:MAG: hypothetical protein AABW72_05500 [archaeon]
MKCTQCKNKMKPIKFDVGYGVEIESHTCEKCGFNITDNKKLDDGLSKLRENMNKEVKIIRIGTGIGIRFPNDIAKLYSFKEKEEVLIKPELDGLKILSVKNK